MPTHRPHPDESLLRAALELEADAEIRPIGREPLGEGTVAGFEVTGDDGPLVYYVDTSRRAVEVETGLVSGDPIDPDARVWLHPADPHLPALSPLAFAHAARTILARLGVRSDGVPAIEAYRPGRRAVLRIATDAGDVWLKAVPPARSARLAETHEALAGAGVPVPRMLGWSDHGVLVLASAAGIPAPVALAEADDGAVGVRIEVDAFLSELDALRTTIARAPLTHPARTGMRRRLDWYADRLVAGGGDRAARVTAVREAARSRWGRGTLGVIHGDLHFGQLFLDAGARITGVIDVDTAGVGDRADDPAAFIAHAVASATLAAPIRRDTVWDLAEAALSRWSAEPECGGRVGPRTATHLLGHALGAYEADDPARTDLLIAAAAAALDGDLSIVRARREASIQPKSGLTAALDRV